MSSVNFSLNPTTGHGATTVAVTPASTNDGTTNKLATITASNGAVSKTVSVKQTYCPYAQQFASTHFYASGGSIYFTVHTEYDVVFRSVPDWITISDESGNTYAEGQRVLSGAVDGKTLILTADENTGDSRTVVGTFNMGHYIGDTLQNRYTYFSFSQDAAYRLVPLTFDIKTGGTIVFYHARTLISDVGDLTVQYSKDNGATWTNLTSSTGGTSINVNAGERVMFRGNNAKYGNLPLSYTSFSGSTATFEPYGNIMSLVNSTGFTGETSVSNEYAFNRLFANTNITTALNLVMPATTVAAHAYTSMFQDCTGMTQAPELPAYTLTTNCYDEMFNGCSSLNYIRCYATSTAATNCTYNWVRNVAPTGTFVKEATMTTWTVGNNGIPTNWVTIDHSGSTPTQPTWTIYNSDTTNTVYGNINTSAGYLSGFEVRPGEVENRYEAVPFAIQKVYFSIQDPGSYLVLSNSTLGQYITATYDNTLNVWYGEGSIDVVQGTQVKIDILPV